MVRGERVDDSTANLTSRPVHRRRGRDRNGTADDLEFLFRRLGDMPSLRAVLLARMDDEYRNYRLAIERTLAAMTDVMRFSMEPLDRRLGTLEAKVAAATGGGGATHPASRARLPAARLARSGERIKWGSTADEIRANVLTHLGRVIGGQETLICIETLRTRLPSALRWIYGRSAVFDGLDDLRAHYSRSQVAGNAAVEATQPAAE
jgi:hypothetical protein